VHQVVLVGRVSAEQLEVVKLQLQVLACVVVVVQVVVLWERTNQPTKTQHPVSQHGL
jgi:hypothetical protein